MADEQAPQKYIGVKIVEAWPQTGPPKDASPSAPGYAVRYSDGYVSWSPKDVFEAAYFPMTDSSGATVSVSMVDAMSANVESRQIDDKTTLAIATCLTRFKMYETSSCVDPENFDQAVGKKIATERIRGRLWELLGFVVSWGRFGLQKK